MITTKSPLLQHTLDAITLILVLGALSMIWPVIIGLFLGMLLLLRSCSAQQELAVRSWTEIGNLSLVFIS
ncbi:MAG: hypothetical protein A4E19_09630 [Nitrospira sp. SG-bin1]|nr:MAG: hypothetical protein A4E19_09630 [Nitrospira sp. SG-bin1]